MDYEDLTTFDAQDRNDWLDGVGAVDARIANEDKNFFWSGKMEAQSIFTFEPGLRKKFDIDPALMGGVFVVTYRYRFKQELPHPIQIAMTNDKYEFWTGTVVMPGTPVGVWQNSEVFPYPFTPNNQEVLLGLRGTQEAGKLYEFDIDDIRIKKIS